MTSKPDDFLAPGKKCCLASLSTLGIVTAILILFATLLLIPEIRFGRRAREAEALVEEVSE